VRKFAGGGGRKARGHRWCEKCEERRRSGKEKKIGQKREMGSCRLAPDGDGSVVMRPC